MDPPNRAAVLSGDEKPQIGAFGRTRKGMPMKPGQPAMKTQDCRRNGATTLFAALNILDGTGHRTPPEHHRRGVCDSIEDPETSVQDFAELHNEKEAKPFKWTASPEQLITAHQRGYQKNRTKISSIACGLRLPDASLMRGSRRI